ncbi:hypothetical protein HDV63DRAFT_8752 [Trichoderma sp. SZMC 28014]
MSRPHIHLHSQCGACGDDFSLGQKIVAAIRKSRSIQVINAYTFPDYGPVMIPHQISSGTSAASPRAFSATMELQMLQPSTSIVTTYFDSVAQPAIRYIDWLTTAWRRPRRCSVLSTSP